MSNATPEQEQDDETTTSAATRWQYTNDVLAALLLVTLSATVAYSMYAGTQVPDSWLFRVAVGLAAVWTFGTKSVEALQRLRNGGGGGQ